MSKPKAVALYSGGLDSTLAILIMAQWGVEIEALHFNTDLIPDKYQQNFHNQLKKDADKFGFKYTKLHLGQKFYDMVANPVHGYGKNMNPCIDCKILMISEAGKYMRETGADFIITGEVVGQRPMSQMRQTLYMIENRAELEGLIVRPLSGRILEPTIPEEKGLIKREWLLDINGRSRKAQTDLAAQYGLEDYPNPAGGCLLTDPNYASRLKDMLDHDIVLNEAEIFTLRVGRHFRLSANCRLVVGRDEPDNNAIEELILPDDYVIEVKDAGSPIAILRGQPSENELHLAAAIVAGYSSAKKQATVIVDIDHGDDNRKVEVKPAGQDIREKYHV